MRSCGGKGYGRAVRQRNKKEKQPNAYILTHAPIFSLVSPVARTMYMMTPERKREGAKEGECERYIHRNLPMQRPRSRVWGRWSGEPTCYRRWIAHKRPSTPPPAPPLPQPPRCPRPMSRSPAKVPNSVKEYVYFTPILGMLMSRSRGGKCHGQCHGSRLRPFRVSFRYSH